MKGRLLGAILPASITAAALGTTVAVHRRGIISDGVFFWAWPSLIAVMWLALAVAAVFMRWTKWVWPPLIAFVVQLIGLLLLIARVIPTPLDVFYYSLGTFFIVLFAMLIVWLILAVRTRALERKLMEGGGEGVDAQALARIRKDMADALSMLRRAGSGRNAIYELPWFLVMGRPQGGKTFAIKNSGLSLPVRKDWVKGAGGTFTVDWFFTNEMIFLDTPGKWVQEGVSEEGSRNWTELLRLLRRHRGRRPLDGLVVVVPADDLLSRTEDELVEQAAHARDVIDLILKELKFRFPVYLLITKTDLVEGFVDFFKGLPANRKHQIFGWSHPDPNDKEAVGSIRKAFGRVLRRMQTIRMEILARTASATTVRRLFFFTEEFRRLEDPLATFAETLFQADPYHENPVFRGFYFTSATQGEGAPLGQAMAQLARNLGVRGMTPAAPETEVKRSYFLLDLFRTLMAGDEGLVSRTARHWMRRRRDTVLVAFLPATLATVLLFFALISYVWNRGIYNDAAKDIPEIVKRLATKTDVSSEALTALKDIDQIRRYHQKMRGFTLLRGMGMRQPGALADETFRIFQEELQSRVLQPTFSRAQQIAVGPGDFGARADAFYSVVWLRQGNAVEYGNDLKGFERIWNRLQDPGDAVEARKLLVMQFEHLLRYGNNERDLLRGFDLAAAAESIRKGTSEMGSASAIRRYVDFQDACKDPSTPNDIRSCHKQLEESLNFGNSDLKRLSNNLQSLKRDLLEIQDSETGAKQALESLRGIRLPDETTAGCFKTFESEIVPLMTDYYSKPMDDLISQCQREVNQKGKGAAIAALDTQDAELKKKEDKIVQRVNDLNQSESCSSSLAQTGAIDLGPLFKLSRSYRRVECTSESNLPPGEVKKIARSGGGQPPVHVIETGGMKYFTRQGMPSYNQNDFNEKKVKLAPEIELAKGLPPAQRAVKDAQIQKQIRDYGAAYEEGWKRYLSSIKLKGEPSADRGTWLQALARSDEWRTALEPAANAVAVTGDVSDAYYGGVYQRLQGLSSLSPFLNTGLGEYLAKLRLVGEDVSHCEQSASEAAQFRSAFSMRNPQNSLVAAQIWVDEHGGESLAKGSLRNLLQRPLVVAQEALGSPNDPNKRWSELRRVSEQLSHKFPFSGSDTDELARPEEVMSLFGGRSGTVATVYAERDKQALNRDASDWLQRAQDLSEIFYDPGSDQSKPYNLKITVKPDLATIEPAKAAEDHEWRLQAFTFDMSDGYAWGADKDVAQTKTVKLPLFGDDATGNAKITLVVGHRERQGALKLKVAWVDLQPSAVVSSADGAWAPLKALAKLKVEGATGNRVTVPLEAKFVYKNKKDPDGKLTVPVEFEGKELAKLLDLIKHGLGTVPASQ